MTRRSSPDSWRFEHVTDWFGLPDGIFAVPFFNRTSLLAFTFLFLVVSADAIQQKRASAVALVTADDDDDDALAGGNDTRVKLDALKSDLIKFSAKRDFLRGERCESVE